MVSHEVKRRIKAFSIMIILYVASYGVLVYHRHHNIPELPLNGTTTSIVNDQLTIVYSFYGDINPTIYWDFVMEYTLYDWDKAVVFYIDQFIYWVSITQKKADLIITANVEFIIYNHTSPRIVYDDNYTITDLSSRYGYERVSDNHFSVVFNKRNAYLGVFALNLFVFTLMVFFYYVWIRKEN